jgi:hypothetical protein
MIPSAADTLPIDPAMPSDAEMTSDNIFFFINTNPFPYCDIFFHKHQNNVLYPKSICLLYHYTTQLAKCQLFLRGAFKKRKDTAALFACKQQYICGILKELLCLKIRLCIAWVYAGTLLSVYH